MDISQQINAFAVGQETVQQEIAMLRADVKALCKENTKLIRENLDLKTELNKLRADAAMMSALKRILKSTRALLDAMSDDEADGTLSDDESHGPDGTGGSSTDLYGADMAS